MFIGLDIKSYFKPVKHLAIGIATGFCIQHKLRPCGCPKAVTKDKSRVRIAKARIGLACPYI